jgi:putative nucleotidyltransferase with HDIG domain
MSTSERRARAEALLFEFTQTDALRKHGRAVEEAMRAYARWYGVTDDDAVDTWGIVGLLHDFDYEQNTTEETHLHVGKEILRERGYSEEVILAICSHADYMKIPRDTPLRKAIYACDELVGFIGACVKVRPSKKLADLPVESVVKKLKDKAFARSVDRSYVYGGVEAIGRPLDEHVRFLIDALKPIADEPVTERGGSMRRITVVSLFVVALSSQAGAASAQKDDTGSIESTVAALYQCISGPPGARDWARFQALFVPEAHLVFSGKTKDGTALHTAMTPTEFADQSKPYFLKEGFFESSIANKIDQFGTVAHVFSTYESRHEKAGKPFSRGINSIQLLFDGKRWWVVSLVWDSERADNPIPAKYLK